jgi:hypothetical protein
VARDSFADTHREREREREWQSETESEGTRDGDCAQGTQAVRAEGDRAEGTQADRADGAERAERGGGATPCPDADRDTQTQTQIQIRGYPEFVAYLQGADADLGVPSAFVQVPVRVWGLGFRGTGAC